MRVHLYATAIAALALVAGKASAVTATLDFQDGTDQGFGTGFGNDASANFPVTSIGGSLRLGIAQTASFQEAGRETSNPSEPFYLALLAASGDEANYVLSYDYYIDTSLLPAASNGNFLQIGTYINSGSGYYAQDANDISLNGTQLASGAVFSGTVTETFTAKGYNIPAGETFFRPGFILNGDGSLVVYFDNVTVSQVVPEPTTLAAGLALSSLLVRRRRAK
jgi:hypothetical protein